MSRQYDDGYVTDDDVTDDENVENADLDEEEESYVKSIVRDIMEEFGEDIKTYVVKPHSPDQVTQNEAVKKLVMLKVQDKVLESFECKQVWEDDEELQKLFQACKRAMKKDPDLEALDAMRHVLRKSNGIEDLIDRMLEEENNDEEEED
jgi:uncharacterized protein (DUF4415 family)